MENERYLPLKYFVCALAKINLGIPAEQTERIIQVTRSQDQAYENENGAVFISLPAMFKQKDPAPHGIVLKPSVWKSFPDKKFEKATLLTPKIDSELEIPEEEIHSLPRVMSGMYGHFRGAYCTGQTVILILAPEKLMGVCGD